ncbi:MAG: outer membrane protein assembly factor BamA [Halioglobus sp.]|jgi:outer membrane protein assembly factor BamA
MCKSIFFLFYFLTLLVNASAQSVDYFVVSDIVIKGNKRTKPNVIFNELDFAIGDTIYTSELPIRKKENEKRLLGTALFTGAILNISKWNIEDGTTNIVIALQENWYIYPSLIFELADRNFNVWWTDQNRDFSRVNYGLSIDHINVTGRKDKLKLKVQQGYTRKYELKYNYPYISQTWGAFGEIFFANQKEIGYTTNDNKTVFEKRDDERILLRRFRTGLGANYRPDVYQFHDFKLEYHQNSIDDVIAEDVAPDYFLNGETSQRYFALKYDFSYDKRIFNLYPEGGFMFFGNITKEGLGIFDDFNNLSVAVGVEKYFQLGERWIWGGRIKAKTNLIRNTVAFANNTGLGYGNDLVRGYELYVVDGTDWALAKTSLRYRLYKKNMNWGKYMLLQQFKQMNLRIFLRANLDFGFVNEPTYKDSNTLNNRFLVGYGPAVDMLLYHTFIMSFEYSFNHLGEGGLFLSSSFNF